MIQDRVGPLVTSASGAPAEVVVVGIEDSGPRMSELVVHVEDPELEKRDEDEEEGTSDCQDKRIPG